MCYGETRFGRQKVPVNRKYGHDTQGVISLGSVNFRQRQLLIGP